MKKDKGLNDVLKVFGILFVIILIAFAVGSYLRSSSKPKIETEYSNGFTFIKSGNFWYTTIKNPILNEEYNVDFRYPPSQVTDISIEGDPTSFFRLLKSNNLNAAYFTFNPTKNLTYVNLAAADLAKFLNVINGVTLVAGCTINETVVCSNRPIITCKNQKDESLVIYIETSKDAKVSMEENCLTIQGEGDELVKAYTKLLFLWYNIL